jgi:hypothetical protein
MRPLDAGGLSLATPIESFTAVLLQLNVHYKTRVAVKFTGIADDSGPGANAAPVGSAGKGEKAGDRPAPSKVEAAADSAGPTG